MLWEEKIHEKYWRELIDWIEEQLSDSTVITYLHKTYFNICQYTRNNTFSYISINLCLFIHLTMTHLLLLCIAHVVGTAKTAGFKRELNLLVGNWIIIYFGAKKSTFCTNLNILK